MPNNPRISRVQWNPRMSSKRLNELLSTPNIHEDDEDAILGELWLRESLPYGELPVHGASARWNASMRAFEIVAVY